MVTSGSVFTESDDWQLAHFPDSAGTGKYFGQPRGQAEPILGEELLDMILIIIMIGTAPLYA